MKNTDIPMVSIRCITYNHEPYIRKCLEGFVMQKTNFKFEAIVHDDASTDHTADIIREYAAKYPNIIKPIYETENQYSKHDGSLRRILDAACTGKYFALCEGDDYWIDPLKLQKQVDFLEENPEYSAVFGNKLIATEDGRIRRKHLFRKKDYNIYDVMSGLMPGVQNICCRREVYSVVVDSKSNSDFILYYRCGIIGKLKYLNEDFAVYRKTGNGVSTIRSREMQDEASFRERFVFHQELNFKYEKCFVRFQANKFSAYAKSPKSLLVYLKKIHKYRVPTLKRYIWFPIFLLKAICLVFWDILLGRVRKISRI